MSEIRAILFDVDGTLLDSTDFIYSAFEYAFDTHGIARLSREEMRLDIGCPLDEVYSLMVPGCDTHVLTESHRRFQERNLNLIQLFSDTIPVLEELKGRSFKLGAVTTRSRRTSVRSLEVHDIAKYFDIVVSAEDVSNLKPHPEPVEKALSRIKVEPIHAMMVGDTAADILAGKNAGTKTVAALYGFGGESLRALKPDYAIQRLSEILQFLE